MDINSLLSPQDSPARDSELRSPPKGTAQANLPPASTPMTRTIKLTSPQIGTEPSPSMALSSPPPSEYPRRPHRQASTSGMDTLADLAAMQHHQQMARANAGGLRTTESYEAQLSSANIRPSLQAITRTHSGSRSSLDIRMADAPAQTPPPRVFTSPSLSEAELQRVSELVQYLADNSHAYDSHVQLIKLLYRGFVSHFSPTSSSLPENDPSSYELLGDLKQALEAMSTRFSLGEDLWEIKLRMLQFTAGSLEDGVALMEAFEKAVSEEQASTKLWALYGEWFLSLYSAGKPDDTGAAELSTPSKLPSKLSEEDKIVLGEVFNRDQMMEVWRRGAEDTKFRIDESTMVWDKYLDLRLAGVKASAKPEDVTAVKELFIDRLGVPHSGWEDTFQRFSTFISTHASAEYEEIMVAVNRHSSKAKSQYSEREAHEIKIKQAVAAGDSTAEWGQYAEYLGWELSRNRKKNLFQFDLVNALYLRTLLRFPSVVDAWEDYLTFLAEDGAPNSETRSQLSILGRACDHCPWSGTLWSQYILAAELENLPFADIGQIKHKATSTGLLDFGGIEEMLKIHSAWCGSLKRQAFQHNSTDDELDVAEVGIRSAIEDVETLGKTKYGPGYTGDPQYRLERMYIKFLTQNHNYSAARDTWKDLMRRHGDNYEFWLRFYSWEMLVWATAQTTDGQPSYQTPSEATIVLRQAVQRQKLDWPEKIIETYLSHCEDHENAAELQTAILLCRKVTTQVQERRTQEALEAAETVKQQVEAQDLQASQNSKRKREAGEEELAGSKKVRADDDSAPAENASQDTTTGPSALKRDRENATVIVRNLPHDVTEKRIRHFFNDCGKINSVHLAQDDDSTTATLEFETKDDALTAQTKDQKLYEDNIIEVQIGTRTTLYVTNFPPTADESYIRNLFSKFGTIIDIRFPSLKYDTHRRFCYVQFQTSEQAHAAMELDGKDMGENLRLLAKISDPAHKKAREGPMQEGREVYVSNVDWNAKEKDVQDLFSQYGKVERVRIPRKIGGQSKGIAFVVFSEKTEAEASLALNSAELKSRAIHVEISTSNPSKRQATTIVRRAASPGEKQQKQHGKSETKASDRHPTREDIASRTVVLLNVPDTVNDARIKEFMQRYGDIVKITLRPDHKGAVVEYRDVRAAGMASLEIEGHEITPGRKLRVGTFEELKQEKEEIRNDKPQTLLKKGHEAEKGKPQFAQSNVPIRRPAQRGGRRGGLGLKRGSHASGEMAATNGSTEPSHAAEGEAKVSKTNADFKAMFTK